MQQDRVYSYSFFAQNQTSVYALYVMEIGKQRCFANQQWGPEERAYYQFLHVISGKGEISIGKRKYPASANDVFLFFPNDKITYQSDLNEPLEYAWVGFHGNDTSMLIGQTGFNRLRPCVNVSESENLIRYLEQMYENRGQQPENAVSMCGYMYLYLAGLLHFSNTSINLDDASKIIIERAVAYIVHHYPERFSEDDLAKHISVSKSWLYRTFVRYMGIPPVKYISEYRIEQSAVLLLDPSQTIVSIAYAVGFHDPFYYSKVFKQVKGMTPTEYRVRYAKQPEPSKRIPAPQTPDGF